MKINQNIFICALLALMLLLCVNAVSAEDTLDMNLTSENSDDIVASPVDIEDTIASDSEENGDEMLSQAVGASDGDENVLAEGEGSPQSVVINKDNFYTYFDENGNLKDSVCEGSTLDFQGSFVGKYTVNIAKSVNVISSTGDALFDSDSNKGNDIYSFNVLAGADNTNITGLNFKNYCLYVKGASYVTVDTVHMVANVIGVGSGTGFISIHTNAYYTTVKNSYFENGGTTSSVLVLGKGGKYASFDNNIFNVTGNSGNVVSSNIFVGTGDNPECASYTNNVIYNAMPEAATMYAMTVCGANNVVENNTIHNFKGNGIVNQYGATSTKNVYRNNVITGGASINAGSYSIIENNYLEGTLTIAEGCAAVDNTAGVASISGKNTVVENNTFNGAVTVAKAATNTTFTNNHLKNGLTVNSDSNVITDNQIASSGDYAIDLKTSQNNVVENNTLSSKDKVGDDAVSVPSGKVNNISDNGVNAIIQINAPNSWMGNNNIITVTVVNASGNVSIKVNGKEFNEIPLNNSVASFEVDADDIKVGLNDVTAIYGGSDEIAGDSKDTTFRGLDNVVFQEIFFDFFNADGSLKDDVPYNELVFKGSFSKSSTVQYIKINRPLKITSDSASLSLIGMVITADDVTVDGLKFSTTVNSATSALGDLISVEANNVTLTNLDINYRVTRGDYDAIAINVCEADDVKITNNKIVFASVISADTYSANAINLDGVSNALVDNNVITTTLPGLYASNYDQTYFMMGLNTVNPVRMREVEDSIFSGNTIESSLNNVGESYPTIQCLLLLGSNNVLFDSNKFKMVDTKSKLGAATYLYAFNFGYSENVTILDNEFYMSTTSGQNAAGTAYALQGVESSINLIGNNITTVSNGPNLGFYVSSMYGGSSQLYIADNLITVTGYANTSEQWALISGIEITNGDAQIYNNTIYTYNNAGYIDEAPVHGVSYGQYMYGERSFDVRDNIMYIQGKYTVSVLEGTKCDVVGNILYAEELIGDESVAPGYVGIVENNTPPFDPEIIIDCQTTFDGYNSTVTVTVTNATGNVTIRIGNKVFEELVLVDGSVTQVIDAEYLTLGDNEVNVEFNGEKYYKAAAATGNLEVLDGIVTNDTFFSYFDESGILANYIPEDITLTFVGEFSDLSDYAIIDKPVTLLGSDATLNNIGFVLNAKGIVLDNMTLIANTSLGDLIGVYENNITVSNMFIFYAVGNEEAIAINIMGAEDVNVLNNTMYFESYMKRDSSAIAINVEDASDVLIDNNNIKTNLSAVNSEWTLYYDYGMMGVDKVHAVRIIRSDEIEFTNNEVNSAINALNGADPTMEAILIVDSNDVLFDGNDIEMIDEFTPVGTKSYLYAITLGIADDVTISNNNFNIATEGGENAKGSAYAIQLVTSNVEIVNNNITSVSNGPNLGIYVSISYDYTYMMEEFELYIAQNNINITGSANGTSSSALVSGIEIGAGISEITDNNISVYNKLGYVEKAHVYGISYIQSSYMPDLNINNNDIRVEDGDYAISINFSRIEDLYITENNLVAHNRYGDKAATTKYSSAVINNNTPIAEIAIDAENVWMGSGNTITVTIPNAVGNVTISVNGKEQSVELNNSAVTVTVGAEDLVVGENIIDVTYEDISFAKASNSTTFQVLNGVITNETYQYYFDANGNLNDIVPNQTTLDFQGLFLGKYPVYINKAVNVISSTGDALFDCGASYAGNAINSFNIVAGGDNTNITGLKFINYCLYIKGASNVTVDGVSIVANKRGVGSGTGFLSIHTGAYNTLVKNGYFENGGTGSSLLVLGKGGAYAVFDHNVFNITGSSGNILSANQHVGSGDAPEHVSYTNNVLYNNQPGSVFCYAMTVSGSGNLLENNTIYHNGSGILNQYGASSTGNVYRNNTLYGNTNFNPSANSIVENNKIYATTNIAANTIVSGNTFKNVAISGTGTKFTNNTVTGTVTVSGNNNELKENNITSTGDYAIDLKSTTGNNVTENRLVAKENEGDAAVKYVDGNVVKDNYRFVVDLSVSVADIKVGETALINISISNGATGTVQVIVDGKKYSLDIKNGTASVEVPDLRVSQYTVGVTYSGDEYFLPGENSTTFKVSKFDSTAVITTTDLSIGKDVNVTVAIEGATGDVTIVVDGKRNVVTLNEGVATYTIESIAAGSHTVTAIYMGDDYHDFVTNSTTFVIEKLPTAIDLEDIAVDDGSVIPISFVINESATGKVYFELKGKKFIDTLVNGAVDLEFEGLARGNYTLSISYEGDAMYVACAKEVQITVNGMDAGLKANASDINVGENATISIEINSEATGAVVVILGNEYPATIVDGKAVVIIPDLSNGTYNAVVKFAGDGKFRPDETTVTFNVLKAEIPEDINVTMDIPEGTTAPEFSIKLPEDATGNFSVTVDGNQTYTQELVNGSATVKVPELAVGNHTIVSSYSGDDKYDGFTSDSKNVTIPKASIPGGEDAINVTAPQGTDSPTYSINLPGATGNLTVTVDGKDKYTQALVNGSASVTVPGLSQGDHNITVTYSGDAKFSSLTKDTTFHVPVVKLSENKDVTALYTANAYYKVRVTVDGKAMAAGEKVVINFNGKNYEAKTDKNGYASFKLPIVAPKSAKYPITATYKDVKVSNNVKVNSIVKAKNVKVKKSKKVNKIKVTLKKVNGKYLKGKTLKLKLKGKTLKAKTNKKGVATFKVKKNVLKKLKVGKKYKYKVTYLKNTVTKKVTVKK